MITVGTTVVSGSPINGGGGGGVPLPSTDGYLSVTGGAYDTPSSASAVVNAGISALVGYDPAGTAIVSDGAGGIQSTSTDVSTLLGAADSVAAQGVLLPTALPGTALHLHRLNQPTGALADQGSAPVAAVIVGTSAVRATPGPYRWGGGIELVSPAATDRITVATSVPVGDCSIALTVQSITTSAPSAPANKVLLALWDQGTLGAENTLALLLNTTGGLYAYSWGSGVGTAGAVIATTWTGAHRCVVTYQHGTAGATKQVKLYIDGVLVDTTTATSPLLATKTQATALGIAGDIYGTGACAGAVISDSQVWGSMLTAAQVAADWRRVRGAL